jgi:hypothetical protein
MIRFLGKARHLILLPTPFFLQSTSQEENLLLEFFEEVVLGMGGLSGGNRW